jgi:hypothetical protein
VADVGRETRLTPDEGEFADVRWWTRADLAAADPAEFDPHLGRFLAKIGDCSEIGDRRGSEQRGVAEQAR